MLPCNFTSENYILIIVFKYNNYDRGMLSDLSVQMETPNWTEDGDLPYKLSYR